MPTPAYATEPRDLVYRLRRVLSSVQLDCRCRMMLDGALDRFSDLERRRRLRNGLRHARHRRDRITGLIAFLAELDEITEHEGDRSVFEDMALLFDDIGASAAEAAQALREAVPVADAAI